jgi:ferredoxin
MRIRTDTEVRIGAGNCVRTAPGLFDQDDEGTVELLNPTPDPGRYDAARGAEDLCPSSAISLTEEDWRPSSRLLPGCRRGPRPAHQTARLRSAARVSARCEPVAAEDGPPTGPCAARPPAVVTPDAEARRSGQRVV